MKKLIFVLLATIFVYSCNSSKTATSNTNERLENLKANDTVKIANDEIEYEIIIIEPGFNFWLASRARQRGYYSQTYLENRNYQYVIEWNQRVTQPQRFDSSLYELQIDYQPGIDYGYEVNYMLYNYFIYFQLTYKQRLGAFVPRI
ncbi:hypothetical protein FPF71_15780 [Algibacter amylolyticus]|uniref:Lipoprotein n=1 Tax=Algibacter amylolyticus TaxID=1608400 RepID=A0A5M7B396_9FLAO|nr:DUF6146 family protein [Algibacter amylolyticus]KAA5821964.1 hypothetical protein F2B50_15780 [Algibacter amylolyticus]MBB5269234.1 hypothetical protein [Algibacter amylolyticus]TSJ73248.1 hypothetical protein FPF71_15780 [Algibacter amylolyticus]